jgi:hypothetical protein
MFDSYLTHEPLERCFLSTVVIHVREIAADHGTGHGKLDGVAAVRRHDLNVLAPRRIVTSAVSSIDALLDGKDEPFEAAQRSVPDADRCVVGKRNLVVLPTRKECLQVWRTWLNEIVDTHVAFCVERVQVGTQPRSRALDSHVPDRDGFGSNCVGSSTGQKDVDGFGHGAAAKGRQGTPAAEQRLVDIVMEDLPETPTIFAAERSRERLDEGIADRVGMAQTFALDELHGVIAALER